MEKRKERLLVVDNEPIHTFVVGEILRSSYELLIAKSGEKALESARANRPDLILLDVELGGMNGYDVCRELKADERTRDIPVLFLTVKSDSEDETRGFDVGCVDYIHKPISPSLIRARVRTHLELRRQQEKLAALRGLLASVNDDARLLLEDAGDRKRIAGMAATCEQALALLDETLGNPHS